MTTAEQIMARARERVLGTPEPRPDLRVCPNNSNSKTGSPKDIELFGHKPRSTLKCGRVALLRNRTSGATVAARLYCNRKACPECGPRRRAQLVAHYTAAIGATPVVRLEVARDAWPTLAKRIGRAKGRYLRVPAPGGRYVVFASGVTGDPVFHLEHTLAAAFETMPSDLARVSSSRCWSAAGVSSETGFGEQEAGWELLGLATVSLDQVVEVAKAQGCYVGPVDPRDLPSEWGEAHVLDLPEVGTLAYRRFAMRIGLHWPDRSRGGLGRAA
jgi:hypothetical protein